MLTESITDIRTETAGKNLNQAQHQPQNPPHPQSQDQPQPQKTKSDPADVQLQQEAKAFQMSFSEEAFKVFVPCLNEAGPKVLLHVGAGSPSNRRLPLCFQGEDWMEVRVDIDKRVKPNIVATVTDMQGVPDERSHAVFSSHAHEHLNDFEVEKGFAEIYRVLRPGGFLLMNVPDLKQVAQMIVDGQADEVLYDSKAGPVRPIDMMFGHQLSVKKGNAYMSHRTGFTAERLERFCLEAGFVDVRVRTGRYWDLWVVAVK